MIEELTDSQPTAVWVMRRVSDEQWAAGVTAWKRAVWGQLRGRMDEMLAEARMELVTELVEEEVQVGGPAGETRLVLSGKAVSRG